MAPWLVHEQKRVGSWHRLAVNYLLGLMERTIVQVSMERA
jgi:hypothetical protein